MGSTAKPPRWLDPAEMHAWRSFMETQVHLAAALSDDLAEFGLTLGDYEVLAWLSEAPDHRMRMCDLASALRLSASGLTRRLDGLVRIGAVQRAAGEHDRRVMWAQLTASGTALLERAAPAHVRSVRARLIDLLTPDEVTALGTIFGKVRRQLACPTLNLDPAASGQSAGAPA